MYYASIGILAIVIHIIINFEDLKISKSVNTRPARVKYRSFLYGVMVYYVCDILWGILYEQRLIVLTYIDTVGFFLSMVLSVLMWTQFVVAFIENNGIFGKWLVYSGWTIVGFEVLALICNIFSPVVFGFNDNNEYVPGNIRFITLIIQMALFCVTSIYTLLVAMNAGGRTKSHHRTIGFSGLVMTVFIALQSLFPLMPFYSIGCLLATCLIHSFAYKDETEAHEQEMESANRKAYRDGLTGVKNKLAYIESLIDIEVRVEDGSLTEYGVVVFDLNGLKTINDTLGHDAGDEYIKSGCHLICHQFTHSPVFRVGGDEFAVILTGSDYENRESLIASFDIQIEKNLKNGSVVVSSGMDIYDPDTDASYNDVFRRADKKMYERKQALKKL